MEKNCCSLFLCVSFWGKSICGCLFPFVLKKILWYNRVTALILTTLFLQGKVSGQQPWDDSIYLTFSATSDSFTGSSKTGSSQVGDVITPPGPWSTSGPVSRGCSQQDSPHQSFLSHSGHVAETRQFRSFLQRSVSTFVTW